MSASPKSEVRSPIRDGSPGTGVRLSTGHTPAPIRRPHPCHASHPSHPSHGPLTIGYWLLVLTVVRACAATNDLASPDDIPPLRPPKPEIAPGFWEQHGLWVLLGGIVAATAIALLWRVLSRPNPPAIAAPADAARTALRALDAAPEDVALWAAISGILRRYFIAALDLPQAELTNSELCRVLRSHPKVISDLSSAVTDLLTGLEHRRFGDRESASVPSDEQGRSGAHTDTLPKLTVVERALALIDQTEQVLKPPVSDSAPS